MDMITRVIIRYAVDLGDGPPDRDWLGHRRQLFERFTLPSLEWQTDQDFETHLLVDPECPYPYGIGKIHKTRDWKATAKELSGRKVLTIRLDSDDMLLPAAVAAFKEECLHGWVRLVDGFRMHRGEIFPSTQRRGPFLACFGDDVYGLEHGSVVAKDVVGRYWVQVIHDRNMKNI